MADSLYVFMCYDFIVYFLSTVKKPECFHYRTHYCSAMTVATYLIRMEPYTQHYLHLQVRVT